MFPVVVASRAVFHSIMIRIDVIHVPSHLAEKSSSRDILDLHRVVTGTGTICKDEITFRRSDIGKGDNSTAQRATNTKK